MLASPSKGANRARADGARQGYVACGKHAVLAFVRNRPDAVRRLLLAADGGGGIDRSELDGLADRQVERCAAADLERLAGGVPHQGIVALGDPPPSLGLSEIDPVEHDLVLALDGLTDPRNVGAVLRSAAAAGVGAVLMARDRAPGLTTALVKAAAGAVECVPIARVVNLARSLDHLRDAGYWILGLDGDAEHEIFAEDAIPGLPAVLVAGSEGRGLRLLTQRVCHRLLRIPTTGAVESLNVSVAVAIALFEIRRRSAAGAL